MTVALKVSWVDRLPAALWLALPVVALMPVWLWCAARLLDRSDDPLGIFALAVLVVLVIRDRTHFHQRPHAGWLLIAALLAAVAIFSGATLPALFRGVLAVLAVCAVLMAMRAPAQPMLALVGLALLALPLLSSLQFFIGYPLRVATAEVSRWLLLMFDVAVTRDGTALTIAGHLVMVDAPCSGIQMGWVAYFTACLTAAWLRVPDARFLRRIPLVGVAVLAGNIVRNTLLSMKEAGLVQWPDWTHDAIGLAVFAIVCLFVVRHVSAALRPAGSPRQLTFTWKLRPTPEANAAISPGTWGRLFALTILIGVTLWPWIHPQTAVAVSQVPVVEWPRELEGQPLQPLALSVVERRFADRFPGAIARFTDGVRAVVLRHVLAPTRMLHPASDCYRGAGYRVIAQSLETDRSDALTRCFIAEKGGQRLRVCENIVDARGQIFTDTSAWYWAAIMGHSTGPWRAMTTTSVL